MEEEYENISPFRLPQSVLVTFLKNREEFYPYLVDTVEVPPRRCACSRAAVLANGTNVGLVGEDAHEHV